MKRSIIIYFVVLAAILGLSLPKVIQNGVVWWKCALFVLWVAFVWALIVYVFDFMSRRVEQHGANVLKKQGAQDYRPRIKNSKLLIELENNGFNKNTFTVLNGTIKRGFIKRGEMLKIYDENGDFVCDTRVDRIEINGNEVKFAAENDKVGIYVDSEWLNETALPDGSVAIK